MPGFTRGRKLDKLGLQVAGHRRAVLRRRAGPGRQPAGRGGRGVRLPRRTTCPRSGWPSRSAPRPPRAARSRWPSTTARSARRSARRSRRSRTPSSSWPGCSAEVAAGRQLVDAALADLDDGELSSADAAAVKLFCTEMQAAGGRRCLQLHGGYGYMMEYPIARLYADARVTRIYGGHQRGHEGDHRQGPRPLNRRRVAGGARSPVVPGRRWHDERVSTHRVGEMSACAMP